MVVERHEAGVLDGDDSRAHLFEYDVCQRHCSLPRRVDRPSATRVAGDRPILSELSLAYDSSLSSRELGGPPPRRE